MKNIIEWLEDQAERLLTSSIIKHQDEIHDYVWEGDEE